MSDPVLKAFEALYSQGDFGIAGYDFRKHPSGEYINDETFSAFTWFSQGIQAALASQQQDHIGNSNGMVQSQAQQEPAKAKHHPICDRRYPSLCDACNAEAQAQQTESRWKPIETAPKNKKIIVRYKNVCDKERTVFAKYIEEFTEEVNSETECETDYHEERDTYYFKEGWVEMIDNWDEFSCVYFDSRNVPTHWMDIPPAPEGEKE